MWLFGIRNIGDINLAIESVTYQIRDDTKFLEDGSLEPTQELYIQQELAIDFCAGETITAKITIEATPGPCEAADEYVLDPP